jgi:hypothetical protein
VRQEDEMRALFGIPSTVAVAALVVLGRPVTVPSRLRRAPVHTFAWLDRYEGTPIAGP